MASQLLQEVATWLPLPSTTKVPADDGDDALWVRELSGATSSSSKMHRPAAQKACNRVLQSSAPCFQALAFGGRDTPKTPAQVQQSPGSLGGGNP